MYIDQLTLENVRTFAMGTPIQFVHPDRVFRSARIAATSSDKLLPKPRLPNVTLLLGDNGSGKTTVLRALAAAAFGPAAKDLLRDSSFVRFDESTAGSSPVYSCTRRTMPLARRLSRTSNWSARVSVWS